MGSGFRPGGRVQFSKRQIDKCRRRAWSAALAVAMMLGGASAAVAGDLYWDTNGSASGSANNGSADGAWGIDPFWRTHVFPVGIGPWIDDSTAIFTEGSA